MNKGLSLTCACCCTPVYEYAVLGHTLMIDMETSYVLL